MKIGKQKQEAKFTILIRNNKTKKYKCAIFENDIKTEKELLNLIKKLLIEHYNKKEVLKNE